MGGVGTYALITSAEAAAYLGGYPQVNSFWALYSGVNATATIQVNDNSVVLIDSITTTIDTTAGATDTITEIVAKINTLTGWTAGLLGIGAALGVDLVTTGALSAKNLEQTAKIYDVYTIDKLIDRATDIIERWCGRKLKTRTYDRQIYDAFSGTRLLLDQYPVTRLGRVSVGRTNSFYVANTMALNFANVEVNATQVRLNADGTVTDIAIASYATINELIAKINTYSGSGWTATAVSGGTRAAYYTSLDASTKVPEMFLMPAHGCKSPQTAYVEIPDDDLEGHYLETTGSDEDRNPGIIYSPGGFSGYGRQSIAVDYIAGYNATIPEALQEACLLLTKFKYDQMKQSTNIKSESIGSIYSVTYADFKAALPDTIVEELNFFKRIII